MEDFDSIIGPISQEMEALGHELTGNTVLFDSRGTQRLAAMAEIGYMPEEKPTPMLTSGHFALMANKIDTLFT